ncbi:MAG: ABC transporter permease [Candidatus Krumholzibacteriia bacterium]
MNLLEGVRIALASLTGHKLRTFLTLLGNIVGTMSVIAVVSLLYGADRYFRQVVLDEGTDVFTITRVNAVEFLTDFDAFLESLNNPPLTLADRDYLEDRMTEARVVGATLERQANLRAGASAYRGALVAGRTADYPLLEDMPLLAGRHLTSLDVVASRPVAVLGWDVAQALFPRRTDPLGGEFKIGNRHFTVVGVVQDRGTVLGNNRNQFVVIPITSFQKVFGGRASVDIKIAARELVRFEEAMEEAAFLMRVRHRLRPLAKDDFAVVTSEQLLNIWAGISANVYRALVPLVGISLVVGGIVLMNIMLVAVTERTREVGVRKALGAPRRAILWQFMVEAITLSVTGGIVGIVVGALLAAAIAAVSPLPFAIAGWSVLLGLAVTFVIGGVFGTYPAWKAAGLDPVEALRYE